MTDDEVSEDQKDLGEAGKAELEAEPMPPMDLEDVSDAHLDTDSEDAPEFQPVKTGSYLRSQTPGEVGAKYARLTETGAEAASPSRSPLDREKFFQSSYLESEHLAKREPRTIQEDSVPGVKRSNNEMRGLEPSFHLDIAPLDLSCLPQRCATPQAASAFRTPPSSTTSGQCYRERTPLETPVTTPCSPGSLSPEPEKEPAREEKPFAIQFLTAGWLPITTSPPEACPLKESLLCLEIQKFSESWFSYKDWENLPCMRRTRSAASRRGTIDILDSEIALFIRALRLFGCGLCHKILGKDFVTINP